MFNLWLGISSLMGLDQDRRTLAQPKCQNAEKKKGMEEEEGTRNEEQENYKERGKQGK
jgi:hypothetical protein